MHSPPQTQSSHHGQRGHAVILKLLVVLIMISNLLSQVGLLEHMREFLEERLLEMFRILGTLILLMPILNLLMLKEPSIYFCLIAAQPQWILMK